MKNHPLWLLCLCEPREGSDYGVFVILKDGTEKPILVLQNIYRGLDQNPNYKAVDVLANYKSRFEVRSKLPTIEKTIVQKESFSMTTLDLAKEWLCYAKSDLNTIKHMFNDIHPKENEISCYHIQQCVEKSLKACLIAKETDPPYIHDLVELIRLCTAYEASFSTIQLYCVSLNLYGVQVRYPNELAVDDSIIELYCACSLCGQDTAMFGRLGYTKHRSDADYNPNTLCYKRRFNKI